MIRKLYYSLYFTSLLEVAALIKNFIIHEYSRPQSKLTHEQSPVSTHNFQSRLGAVMNIFIQHGLVAGVPENLGKALRLFCR